MREAQTLPLHTSVHDDTLLWSLLVFHLQIPVPPPIPLSSTHSHCHHLQMPGLPLPCHLLLTPHRPILSCYDTPPSASEINYLGCPDFSQRWLCVQILLLRAELTTATLLLPRATKPPQKRLKPMTQLTRSQQPRVASAGIAFHTEM